ncbi:MAG: hypothetical protein MJZ63_02605 [Muribaculaceae bacterium]|nr:hypothetical protein [Muribaculaceae bacterium]
MREQLNTKHFGIGDALAMYRLVKKEGKFSEFAHILLDSETRVARNAAWILTHATDEELALLHPMLTQLIDIALHTNNESLRRLTLNIILRLPLAKEDVRTDFLDFCLEHMVRLDTPPGTQALCMKIAHRLCSFYPELNDEFMRIIQSLDLSFYQPAVRCTVRNIMRGKC